MWRPADPEVIAKIVHDYKHARIRLTNKAFVSDVQFLRMKEHVETYTPIIYTVSSVMKPAPLHDMRKLCVTWDSYTILQLRKVAQELHIKGYYQYKKSQLIEAIQRKHINV
jgi:hypothetical protein